MIVIIEDSPIQQLIARDALKGLTEIYVPASPKELYCLEDAAVLIIADRFMGSDWVAAREAYIARNPQAQVVEWSAGCGSEFGPAIGRAKRAVQKSGTGRELKQLVNEVWGVPNNSGSRILESVAAFLGLALTR